MNEKIMIVDDEPIVLEVLKTTLEEENFELLTADSGQKALQIFKETPCEVVITDITMTGISGIDLLFSLKEINNDVEVILITAYASVDTAQAAIEGGAYRYLKKPFDDLDTIIDVVNEALMSYRAKVAKRKELKEAVLQKKHLTKRLGYLEKMSFIGHAVSFPKDITDMTQKIANLLIREINLELLACIIIQDNLVRIYITLVKCILEEDIENLIVDIKKATGENYTYKVFIDRSIPLKLDNIKRLEQIVTIKFPEDDTLSGATLFAIPQNQEIDKSKKSFLEITTAQMAGAIKKMKEFYTQEWKRIYTFVEGITDGVVLLREADKEIKLANSRLLKMLNCKSHDKVYDKLVELGLWKIINEHQSSKWIIGKEIELPNDSIFSVTIFPLEQPLETNIAVVLKDKTKEHAIKRELERSRRLSCMGEMVSGVVHEINTPLTVILGYSQLLMTENIPSNFKHDLNTICQEAMRCQKLIQNLLGLVRCEIIEKVPTEVIDLIEKAIELKQHSLNKDSIKIVRDYPDESILVNVNPGQIQQVLLNLINNAQDSMQETEKKELRLCVTAGTDRAYAKIGDTGTGVSKKYMDKIFNPFFSTKKQIKGQGTGLGLSICHRIIEEYKGMIHAENNKEIGSTFTVELPRAFLTRPSKNNYNGLIITSEQSMMQMLFYIFKKKKIDSKFVMTEKVAIRSLEKEEYDIVFIDFLPTDTKITKKLFELITQKCSKKAIIAYGDYFPNMVQKILENKDIHIIYKPFTTANLQRELDAILKHY